MRQRILLRFAALTSLFFLTISSIGLILARFAQINLLEEALESFESTRFAEAYGARTCAFVGQTSFFSFPIEYNFAPFNADWSGATSIPLTVGTGVDEVIIPFDVRLGGRDFTSLGIDDALNADDYHVTTYYPNFNVTGETEFFRYTTGMGLNSLPFNQYQPLLNGPNSLDYQPVRTPEIQTKSFFDGGREFFGVKFDYFTPQSAPIIVENPDVFVLHGQTNTIQLANYFHDINNDSVTLTNNFTQPNNGTLVLNGDGTSFDYTPNTGFFGSDSFTFEFTDGQGGFGTAPANLTVDSVKATDDRYGTQAGTYVIPILFNDYVEDQNDITVQIVTPPSSGSAVLNSDNTITATTVGSTTTELTYSVTNNTTGESETATMFLFVTNSNSLSNFANDPINVANFDEYWVDSKAGTVTFYPLANDILYDANSTISISGGNTSTGLMTVNPDNSITYDISGFDQSAFSMQYRITDSAGRSTPDQSVLLHTSFVQNISEVLYFEKDSSHITHTTFTTETNNIPGIYEQELAVYMEGQNTAFPFQNELTDDRGYGFDSGYHPPFEAYRFANDVGNHTLKPDNCIPEARDDQFTVPNGGPTDLDVVGTIDSNNYVPEVPDAFFIDVEPNYPDYGLDLDFEYYRDPVLSPLTVVLESQPSNGAAVVNPDNTVEYTPTPGYTGSDSFTYSLLDTATSGGVDADNQNTSNTATVNLTVEQGAVNSDPVAVDDTATLNQNSNVLVDVLDNDTDADSGDTLSIGSVTTPTNGTAVIENGQVRYTPQAGYVGSDSFGYTLSDGNGGTDTATVTITVNSVNTPPVAADDNSTVDEDNSVLVDVLDNDSDPDSGDVLTIDSVATPASGTAVIENGQVRYTPNANFSGSDSFIYNISDGNGGATSAIVFVTINPVNDDPVAVDDTVSLDENTNVLIDVLTNDSDPVENDALTIDSVSTPANGSAVIENGQVRYTPTPGYFGSDSFSYTISDGNGGVDNASVTITVNENNASPDAVDDTASVDEDNTILIDVLANDTDPDIGQGISSDALAIDSITQPSNGTAIIENGQVRYTPTPGYFGSDSFTYTISDGNGGNDNASVSITVTEVVVANNAPVALDDAARLDEGSSVLIDVLANDSDADTADQILIELVTEPSNGLVAIENGQIRYTPNADYFGTDSFTYTVSDGNGGNDTATVSLVVDELKSLTIEVTKSTDEVLQVGETLQVQVSTINPNDSDLDTVITTVQFDSSKFEYVEGSLRRGSLSDTSFLDLLSLPINAQDDTLNATLDGDTITIEYSVIEGGEQENITFELASRVIGTAQIDASTASGDLTASDTEEAEITLSSTPTPRTGGVIIVSMITLLLVGSVSLYINHSRKKLTLHIQK